MSSSCSCGVVVFDNVISDFVKKDGVFIKPFFLIAQQVGDDPVESF